MVRSIPSAQPVNLVVLALVSTSYPMPNTVALVEKPAHRVNDAVMACAPRWTAMPNTVALAAKNAPQAKLAAKVLVNNWPMTPKTAVSVEIPVLQGAAAVGVVWPKYKRVQDLPAIKG